MIGGSFHRPQASVVQRPTVVPGFSVRVNKTWLKTTSASGFTEERDIFQIFCLFII